jgi:hypothetical protein
VIGKEYGLAIHTTLNDVLWNTWNMNARATGHTSSVAGDLKDALSENGAKCSPNLLAFGQ